MDILWGIIIAGILVWLFDNKKRNKTASSPPSILSRPDEVFQVQVPDSTVAPQWKVLLYLRSESRKPVIDWYAEYARRNHANSEIIDLIDQYADMIDTLSRWSMPHPTVAPLVEIEHFLNRTENEFLVEKYEKIARNYEAATEVISLIELKKDTFRAQAYGPSHGTVPIHPDALEGLIIVKTGFLVEPKRLQSIIHKCGATLQRRVTVHTDILIKGFHPEVNVMEEVKRLKSQGYDIRILTQGRFYNFVRSPYCRMPIKADRKPKTATISSSFSKSHTIPVPTHPDLLYNVVISTAGRLTQPHQFYQIIEQCGGRIHRYISTTTDILVLGRAVPANATTKVEELQKSGKSIEIMDQSQFYDFIRELHRNQI